jgi:hypothetical protein
MPAGRTRDLLASLGQTFMELSSMSPFLRLRPERLRLHGVSFPHHLVY